MRLRAVFLWIMIGSLSLAAAFGVMAVLSPGYGRTRDRILVTSLLVGAFSITSLACAIVIGKHRLVVPMWVGISSAGAALVGWIADVWIVHWPWVDGIVDREFFEKLATMFTIGAILAPHIGMLQLPKLKRRSGRIVRFATAILAIALGISLTLIIWFEAMDEWNGQLLGVLSILTACGTVVSPVLALIEWISTKGKMESVPGRISIAITCPRCGVSQRLATGPRQCASCGLHITVEIEEPRCECGYLLYQLQGDTCPECGRAIAEAQRWRGGPEAEKS